MQCGIAQSRELKKLAHCFVFRLMINNFNYQLLIGRDSRALSFERMFDDINEYFFYEV